MKWSRLLLVLCLGVALTLAACGGDDESAGGGATTGAAEASAEQTSEGETLVEAPPTTPPAEIQVSTALDEKPPTDKSMIWLQCELPACARYTDSMRAAAESLGWSFEARVFKNTGEGPAAAFDQAIAQDPDYIAISGIPAAALEQQLRRAEEAGIKVVSGSVPEKASDSPWMSQVGGTLQPDAENLTKWMINDSGGDANIVAVTIPQFPSLNAETDWMREELPNICPDCSYDQLDVTIEEVGAGAVPQKLVGYLQSHPEVDYVHATFSDLGKGLGKVLENAGMRDRVKLTVCCGDAVNAQEIEAGDTDAGTIAPNQYSAYAMVDALARDSVGMDLTETNEKVYESPSWVVESAEAVEEYLKPTEYDWPGPQNFQDQFKELWNVG